LGLGFGLGAGVWEVWLIGFASGFWFLMEAGFFFGGWALAALAELRKS
jgi:hypothetical protein